jgi:hypothetical protein
MRYRPGPDDPLLTVGEARVQNPEGVRVWCQNHECARCDKEIRVTWDKIKAPDTLPFIYLPFRCAACGGKKVTFQPVWSVVPGMGPGSPPL